jgi:hypothetical protein
VSDDRELHALTVSPSAERVGVVPVNVR